MAQIVEVIEGDPTSIKDQINTLAAANTIDILQKSQSSGKFLVVYTDTGPAGQTAEVLAGDPDYVRDQMTILAAGGANLEIMEQTFSAAHYVLVYS